MTIKRCLLNVRLGDKIFVNGMKSYYLVCGMPTLIYGTVVSVPSKNLDCDIGILSYQFHADDGHRHLYSKIEKA